MTAKPMKQRVSKKAVFEFASAYFRQNGWKPFSFQRHAWDAYLRGHSGLVHSATGTGKTMAVWTGPLLEWLRDPLPEKYWCKSRGKPSHPPLLALWVTPLRALAGDTEKSLAKAIAGFELPWTLESRTGDTKASTKQRQRSKLPTALVTTPESLTLMLSYTDATNLFQHLRCVVVDEWHELIGTKRGVMLELALGQLRTIRPQLKTWGLSATLGNLETAMQVLVGPEFGGTATLVHGKNRKKIELDAAVPDDIERFPWAGHLGLKMMDQVIECVERAESSLVFTNTRNQTELWYQELLKKRPDWAGQIALHHGSLDTDVRTWVEEGLRNQRLKAVVCTSSLDLGVDFTAVDQVIQVGSPKGIARLLQRAGRSGHQPDATSRLTFVPTHALELMELAAAREMMRCGKMETRTPLEAPLDLLAQHLVTRGLPSCFSRESVRRELQQTFAYAGLTDQEFEWALRFAATGGESLARYSEFHRLEEVADGFCVTDAKVARRHRMSIGTIVSDVAMNVKYMSGKRLGTVEESFISKIQPGDRFLLAGRLLELVRIRDSVAWVRKATGVPTAVPRWSGGRMPLSSQLSIGIRQKIDEAAMGVLQGVEMRTLRPLLDLQKRWSHLPRTNELLIEQIKTREGYQLFVYPFEGRLVHEGLAAVLAYRLSRDKKISYSLAANDYGFVLQSPTDPDLDFSEAKAWFRLEGLMEDIESSLNATEMAKRHFREIARIAGLIHSGYPGERRSGKHLQASSDLFFDVFCEYDPENMLLAQARSEVLQKQLEWERLNETLLRIEKGAIVVKLPQRPTPFAFPLLVDRLRERLSTESLIERVRRMQAQLEKAAER